MLSVLKSINYGIQKIEQTILILSGITMLIASVWQVITRFILKISFAGTDEVAIFSMMFLVFIGASLAISKREHISLDILQTLFQGTDKKKIFWIACDVLTLFVVIVFTSWIWEYFFFVIRINKISPGLGIPFAVPVGAILAGSLISIFHLLVNLILMLFSKNTIVEEVA